MRAIDADDRPSVNFGLSHPCRVTTLSVGGVPTVRLEEIHAFLWLALKYQEAGRKRLSADVSARVKRHAIRLLAEWLNAADFKQEATH